MAIVVEMQLQMELRRRRLNHDYVRCVSHAITALASSFMTFRFFVLRSIYTANKIIVRYF